MAAVALSIATLAALPAVADIAVLEPVPDSQIGTLLQANFTLPLVLAIGALSDADRQDLITAEVAKLTALLTSQGYLEGRVETSGGGTEVDPLRLWPVPGPRYRIREIRVDGLSPEIGAGVRAALGGVLSQHEGTTALRSVVDDLGRGVLFELRQASFAHAVLREVGFDLDRKAGRADVVFTVDPGLATRFGEVSFHGSLRLDAAEARAFVPFRPGDPYSVTAIDGLRIALDQTGAFRRIRIEAEAVPDKPGVVNLLVRLWDRAQVPMDAAPPRVLLATIILLGFVQMLRMTSYWSDRAVRFALIVPAVLMVGGSALEVTNRLSGFLYP